MLHNQTKDVRRKQFTADVEHALRYKVINEITNEHRRALLYSSSHQLKEGFPGLEYADQISLIGIERLKQTVIDKDFGVFYERIMVLATLKGNVLNLNFLYLAAP